MRLLLFIIILPFFWWAFDASAQVPEGLSSSVPEQWQLTLDVIKSKAQSLSAENDGLQGEYQQLMQQAEQLQQAIDDQQSKNEQMGQSLKDQHGRTGQQERIEELTQRIKAKKQDAVALDEELKNLQRKQQSLLEQQNTQPQEDDQTPQLHKQLEDENAQEVLLQNELKDMKAGDKTQQLDEENLEAENKKLEDRLAVLQAKKSQHDNEKRSPGEDLAAANKRMYEALKTRKAELETEIYAYESRTDELRQSSLLALSWSLKKKKLVHEMVEMDARNNQIRDQIRVLREDIDVLKNQVAKLERRVDFVQDKSPKQ